MKILIADDHALFRDSLRSLFESHGHQVVGEVRDGKEAVEQAHRLRPHVVLMDLAMPVMDGLTATRLIAAELPEVKVLVLTAVEEDAKLFEAIKAGAQGYLLKNLEAEEFFALLEKLQEGEPALSPAIARKLLQEFARPADVAAGTSDPDALTEREREILGLLVEGVTSNRKLARSLGVTENTVKFHVRHILDKLHLHSRAQAVGYALRNRLLEPPED
jgi:DNA-binding NarL/FixJ family response regulator